MFSVKVKVVGAKNIQKNMRRYETRMLTAIKTATHEACTRTERRSQRSTPVRTGNLRRSAFSYAPPLNYNKVRVKGLDTYSPPDRAEWEPCYPMVKARAKRMQAAGNITGAVSYSAIYAKIIHENPHGWKIQGNKVKFLEKAYLQTRKTYLKTLRKLKVARVARFAKTYDRGVTKTFDTKNL